VARAARLARANAYAALEGLVQEGAAARADGPPVRYRPTDPDGLLARLSVRQGEALDRLARSLEGLARVAEPATHEVTGARAMANVVTQVVARAERSVRGVIAASLWRPTLPAWRRAANRATLDVRTAGDAPDSEGLASGTVAADTPTVLVADESRAVLAQLADTDFRGLWSAHPLIVRIAGAALERLA